MLKSVQTRSSRTPLERTAMPPASCPNDFLDGQAGFHPYRAQIKNRKQLAQKKCNMGSTRQEEQWLQSNKKLLQWFDTAGSKVERLEEHGPIIVQIWMNCKDGHIFRSVLGTQKAGWREMRHMLHSRDTHHRWLMTMRAPACYDSRQHKPARFEIRHKKAPQQVSMLKVTPPPGCGGRNVPTAQKSEQCLKKRDEQKKQVGGNKIVEMEGGGKTDQRQTQMP